VKDPVSSGDFSRAFGDDEIISKNSETINNPAIPAPINICPLSLFLFLSASYSILPAISIARGVPRICPVSDAAARLVLYGGPYIALDVVPY
jgi:hypothetical protein